MQRWHLTAGLSAASALFALTIPTLRLGLPGSGGETSPGGAEPTATPDAVPSPDGIALGLTAELDRGALLQGQEQERYLVVEVAAPSLPGDLRRPVDLAVVMDVSGSMAGRGKMENARLAAAELVDSLQPQDRFSLITFSDQGRVLASLAPVRDAAAMKRLIQGIQPTGGTNLSAGVELGLDQLQDPSAEGIRRVVVLSDGMANIGLTDPSELARLAGSRVEQGTSLSTIGLGLDYNEDLLTAMSDAGGGSYHFVDRPGQLAQIFQDELNQLGQVAAREARVQVRLPAGVKLVEVFGYTPRMETDGYSVLLGDLHGGEKRKVVARVRVDAGVAEAMDIAAVDLRYRAAEGEGEGRVAAQVRADLVREEALVQRSVNAEAGRAAAKAHAGGLLERSARSYSAGDLASNQAQLQEAEGLLDTLGGLYGAADLRRDAGELRAQREAFRAAPAASSDEGLYQVKKAKEAARGYSR